MRTSCWRLLVVWTSLVASIVAAMQNDDAVDNSASRPISITRTSPTNVKADWQMFTKQKRLAATLCPIQYFEVKFKFLTSKPQIQSWKVHAHQHFKIIEGVPEGSRFAVQVVAHVCNGDSTVATKWHKNTPTEYDDNTASDIVPLKPPSSVHAVSYQNNILIKWSSPDRSDQKIEGFIVSYGEQVPDLYFKYVSAEHRNLTITDLKYSAMYVIGMRSFMKQHRSDAVYRNVVTKEKSAYGINSPKSESSFLPPPSHLRLKTLSSRSVHLQWVDPSLYQDQRISDERFYAVYYSSIVDQKNFSIVVKAHQVTIYDLEPNQWYKFKVRTGKGILVSPFTDEILGKTLQEETNFPPLKLSNDHLYPKKNFKVKKNSKTSESQKTRKYGLAESKTKRHQKFPKSSKLPMKQMSDVDREIGELYQSEQSSSNIFLQDVQIRVNAYISWPELFPSGEQNECKLEASNIPHNYLFRYKLQQESDDQYVESNHTTNYKFLENLNPLKSYTYQIRYLNQDGLNQPWSQENTLQIPLGSS